MSRTLMEGQREAVHAASPAALDDPYINRALAMIYHGENPVTAWREVAVAMAADRKRLTDHLIGVLNTLPVASVVLPSEVAKT